MKSAFRNAFYSYYFTLSSRSLNPNPTPLSPLILFPLRSSISPNSLSSTLFKLRSFSSSSSMADGGGHAPPSPSSTLEKQFQDFRHHLEDSGSLRDRIRAVAMEIESASRLMYSSLLLVHQSRPIPEVLEKAKAQIGVLKELFHRLAEILHECPGQYYRYNGDWRSETQTVISLLAFMHWLETGSLLMHTDAEEKLGCMFEFLPRYVVNQVTAGDYDCPRKVLKFLTDLHAAFRMLNLRNDFLRKKFDGMKYDLRKVEEVYYDVKIRGLAVTGDSREDQGIQGQS
ncbi:hypothetical protein HYC85_008098 [Camellia sinensis]|uniref:Translin n=1 Tax=Camellia sinensis TaxID=4442 RepID=A0A7J7HQV9_CAMSI|nr:hypothetical protein HYC85_008098 [Camellia sinensis]